MYACFHAIYNFSRGDKNFILQSNNASFILSLSLTWFFFALIITGTLQNPLEKLVKRVGRLINVLSREKNMSEIFLLVLSGINFANAIAEFFSVSRVYPSQLCYSGNIKRLCAWLRLRAVVTMQIYLLYFLNSIPVLTDIFRNTVLKTVSEIKLERRHGAVNNSLGAAPGPSKSFRFRITNINELRNVSAIYLELAI